ncbi:hypothetical protein BC941DRAFT_514563 [Chlamydoabsidia padenii]|nr:hypothetical protein BC941DRAFT_514563 [Chlamydoabsidia padenii]
MDKSINEPSRRKRLKVVRACSECRRKKTKCDNEQPCAPCVKSYSNCQYTMATIAPQQRHPTSKPCRTDESTTTTSNPTAGSNTRTRLRSPSRRPMTQTIRAIEQRLQEIEKTLKFLIQRRYPSLPLLVFSPPTSSLSTCSSSSTTTLEVPPHLDAGTIGAQDYGSGNMNHRDHPLILPPLHHVDMPSSAFEPQSSLFSRNIPRLLLPSLLHQGDTGHPTYHLNPPCIP